MLSYVIGRLHESSLKPADVDESFIGLPANLAEWQEKHPAPQPAPYGVSARGAENWCCDWLVHMGLHDATVTQQSGDGGVDVESATHIVQVKNYTGAVPITEIRELAGVAAVDGRVPVFMTSGTYPSQAEDFADRANMALLTYEVSTGEVFPTNRVGFALVTEGLLRAE